MPDGQTRTDLLTVGLEDYYHVGAFNRLIRLGQWSRFESRLEHGTRRTLALLDEFGCQATFFVLGWVADHFPELVREVADRGHEIGSKGYYHRDIRGLTPVEFRADVVKAREALEAATGRRVLGYRVADGWFGPDDIWRLDVLADEGHLYDSSATPLLGSFRQEPWRRYPYHHVAASGAAIWEFPVSTVSVLGYRLPIGGNALRQLPAWWTRAIVNRWHQQRRGPFLTYFHTWELDRQQPRITAASSLSRLRHYRNLDHMERTLRALMGRCQFGPVAGYLGLPVLPSQPRATGGSASGLEPPSGRGSAGVVRGVPNGSTQSVAVVVPCYNEQDSLPFVRNTIRSVEAAVRDRYQLEWVFVDDGSRDDTWAVLSRLFSGEPRVHLVRHSQNQGLTAAILTGARATSLDVVATIDCDCSYDPHELEHMLPRLVAGVDVVTASPYHPDGRVENVSRWRLVLSQTVSRLYRLVSRQKLATYTSCFRVYRRQTLLAATARRGGFLGMAELLAAIDRNGGVIVEHPATLTVRVLGHSSLRVVRSVLGHLGLLAELAVRRIVPASRPGLERPRGVSDASHR